MTPETDDRLILAVPSKGRLMEDALDVFASAGLPISKVGHERGYLGAMSELDGVVVRFLSASEIASFLRKGRVHMGITGRDLVEEHVSNHDQQITFVKALGFGHADVVIAVPNCWIDVAHVADIETVAAEFRRVHGRRMRVATKYLNLTRRFFAQHGITSYRIVESLGATEGTPAAGTAEFIVDITSTGATLKANNLKMLPDGTILPSEAHLVCSRTTHWSALANEARNEILARIGN